MKIKRGITMAVLMIAILLLFGNTRAWAFGDRPIIDELGDLLGV